MPSTVLFTIAGSAITATTIATFIAKALLTYAISSLFSKKPGGGQSLSNAAADQQVTDRSPVAPGRVIFGATRAGGKLVFMHKTDILDADEDFASETFSAAASVTVSRASNFVSSYDVSFRVIDSDGDYHNTPLTLVGSSPAQGEYSVSNGVYTFNAADYGLSVQIGYYFVSGQRVVGRFLHLVIELACHQVEAIDEILFDDEVVPLDGTGNATGRFAGHVYVAKYLGTADQAADPTLMSHAPDKWTAEHRGRGRAYIYVALIKNPDLFPNGVPNIRANIRGYNQVYDPRDDSTGYSDNMALCAAAYLTNTDFGLRHVYADEIDEDLLIAAANVCDEAVTLAAGGTENRYTCNGSFLTSEKPVDILGRMKVGMAGNIVRTGGRWDIYAGAYLTPEVTLDEDDLRGRIQVKSMISRRDMFNGVKGVYVSPDNGYQPADFPAVTNSSYVTEDDEPVWLDIDLPFTNSASMAQRIAKINLERVRQQISVIMPCKLTAWQVKTPEVIGLDNSKFGWSDKPFEIIGMKLVSEQGEDGAPYLGVDLEVRETAAAVYDWNSGEETTVDPAPNTNLPNPFVIQPPGAPVITETLYETTGSAGVKTRATVTWVEAPDGRAINYQLEYKLASAALWTLRPLSRGTSDALDDLAPGSYDFRVKALNAFGVSSLYSAQTRKELYGLTAAPADISGFSVIKNSGVARAQWTLHPDLDVRQGGAIVVRHSLLTTGAAWVDGIVFEDFAGNAVSGELALVTGTYMAKARDSSGNWSSGTATFVATEGMVTGFTTADSVTEHSSFSGSMSNVVYDGGLVGIQLDTGDLTGSYTFSNTLDATTVATRRFESAITALSYDQGVNIDSITEDIDTWGPIDGTDVNDCDVTLYGRFTDDDPAGTPTWGAWVPFFVADFTCRAAQFRLDFVRESLNHNIVVTELSVAAKDPA